MSLKFSREHTWIDISDLANAKVGVTEHAQNSLGDVVFVDLPAIGAQFKQNDVAGVVESVKTAADIFIPVDGEIVEVNQALVDNPGLVNEDPLNQAWFFKIKVTNPAQIDALLDKTSYESSTD